MALALLVLLAACSPERSAERVTIAGTTFPDTEGERHWLMFRDGLLAASDPALQPRMLIYGQLGSEDQLVSGLRRGRVQFANLSAMAVSAVVPEMALLYAPYLFRSAAEADYVYDTVLTDIYGQLLAEKDLQLISWYEIGFLQVYGIEPVVLPTDVEGRRFRVGAGPAARLFANALDADVIPLGFAEVVASLQTGLIESGENSVSLYARTGIASEAPHLTLTDHSFGVSVIVADKTWWDTLTADQQRVVQSSWPSIRDTRQVGRAESARDLELAEQLGFTVHQLSADERERWMAATTGVTEQLIAKLGGRSSAIYTAILEARERFAANEQQNLTSAVQRTP